MVQCETVNHQHANKPKTQLFRYLEHLILKKYSDLEIHIDSEIKFMRHRFQMSAGNA